jgi:hypothetical protein
MNAYIEQELKFAVGSILDILSEMVVAAHRGEQPDTEWTHITVETLKGHKEKLGLTE